MDSSRSAWVEMMSTPVGDASLVYFRTKRPGKNDNDESTGYGYFVLLRMNSKRTNGKNKEVKLPMKLVTYLKQKMSEYEKGTSYQSTFPTDSTNFKLTKFVAQNPEIDLEMFVKEGDQEYLHLGLTKADLSKLITCMDILGFLLTKQPERNEEAYLKFSQELMTWATALRVKIECQKLVSPSDPPLNLTDMKEKFSYIRRTSFVEFESCLEEFARVIRLRIPLRNDIVPAYDDKAHDLALQYSISETQWEPVQLLVHMIHKSVFEDSHFQSCQG